MEVPDENIEDVLIKQGYSQDQINAAFASIEVAKVLDDTAPSLDPIFLHNKYWLPHRLTLEGNANVILNEEGKKILFFERSKHVGRNFWVAGLCGVVFLILSICVISFSKYLPSYFSMFHLVTQILGVALAGLIALVIGFLLHPRRHITFFRDEARKKSIFRVFQDKKILFPNITYTILTMEYEILATMKKNYLSNKFQIRWEVFTTGRKLWFILREVSSTISWGYRIIEGFYSILIPDVVFFWQKTREKIGILRSKSRFKNYWCLDLTKDSKIRIDRRVAIAVAVLLATGE